MTLLNCACNTLEREFAASGEAALFIELSAFLATEDCATAFREHHDGLISEEKAVKIVRRITGRARFFQRAFRLIPAK